MDRRTFIKSTVINSITFGISGFTGMDKTHMLLVFDMDAISGQITYI